MPVPLVIAISAALAWGLFSSFHGPISSSISSSAGVVQSAFLVYLASALVAGSAMLVLRLTTAQPLAAIVPKALVAGALGVIILCSVMVSVGRLGATAALSLAITAQLAGSVLLDHFGLLDLPIRYASPPRLAGLALLALGAVLVVRN